jgi:hypothetical protein
MQHHKTEVENRDTTQWSYAEQFTHSATRSRKVGAEKEDTRRRREDFRESGQR